MPLILPSERDQSIIEDAVKDPEGTRARPVVFVEDVPYFDRLDDAEWGQADIAHLLTATLSGVLPRRLDNASVRVYADVEGVLVPQMVGVKTELAVGDDDASTELRSASAGALLGEWELGEPVEYPEKPPEFVVRDAVRRNRAYTGPISVDPLGAPKFDLVGSEGFRRDEYCLDPLTRVNDNATLYLFYDTATGGFRAAAYRGLGKGDEASRTYRSRDMPGWRRPTRESRQYAAVEVFREKPDGDDDYRHRADIPYRNLDRPPFPGLVLKIVSTDASPEGSARALKQSREEAETRARGTYAGEVGLPSFDPLVQKGDVSRVEAEERDDDGSWDREYLLRVEAYKHSYKRSLETTVGFSAAILEEELVRVPAFVGPGVTGGVVTELFSARRGSPGAGLLAKVGVSPAVRINRTGRWFDPEESNGQIRAEKSGVWVEVP